MVVRGRDGGVVEEVEDLVDFDPEAGGEVPGVAVFGEPPAPVPSPWWRPDWQGVEGQGEGLLVALSDRLGDLGWDGGQASGEGVAGGGLGVAEDQVDRRGDFGQVSLLCCGPVFPRLSRFLRGSVSVLAMYTTPIVEDLNVFADL